VAAAVAVALQRRQFLSRVAVYATPRALVAPVSTRCFSCINACVFVVLSCCFVARHCVRNVASTCCTDEYAFLSLTLRSCSMCFFVHKRFVFIVNL
jgi:hypothetical protein